MYIYKSKLNNDVFLKNTNNSMVVKYIDEINSSCNKFRGESISSLKFSKFRLFDETANRALYQEDYFKRRRRMSMFLLRVWLFKEAEDIKELEDILWAVCDEYSWALPAHLRGILTDENMIPNKVDLFAAETTQTISEALSLCGEYLHSAVVRRCINEVFKRVIEPFETQESEKYGLSWENRLSNWAAVCGGAVGMAALYLIEDDERLKKITDRAKVSCNRFFASCTDDGVCLEGISYWMYAMQYYVAFDELLKERTGESIVVNEEKMIKLAEFPTATCLANNISIRFSDCGGTHLYFGILCKLHERYGVPIPQQSYYKNLIDICARNCGAVRTIAWFNPDLLHNNIKTDDVFLPNGQWAIIHYADMIVAVKGGNNAEPHNHNDIGSYMYIRGNEVIAEDLGSARYTKSYFSSDRYTFLNTGSHGHSLPIVNGGRQQYGIEYAADKFEKTDNGIRISFADAYDKKAGLKTLIRDLTLGENGAVIRDCFEFNQKTNFVTERIITKLNAKIQDENKVSLSKNGEKIGMIEYLSSGKIRILKDSYTMHNPSGSSDVFSSEDVQQEVTIIEIECATNSDKMEISYIVK